MAHSSFIYPYLSLYSLSLPIFLFYLFKCIANMYQTFAVNVSDFPCPERGVLSILIDYLTSKIDILLFTLLSAQEQLKISIIFHISSR